MTNWGERTASATDISDPAPTSVTAAAGAASAGGRRIRKVAGIISAAARPAMISSAVRQS